MSRGILLVSPVQRWHCRRCTQTATTRIPAGQVASQFHTCRNGLTMPMLQEGVDAKVETVERGDYEAGELVQRDLDGRPVMAAITTRADGSTDTAVYAPSARFTLD